MSFLISRMGDSPGRPYRCSPSEVIIIYNYSYRETSHILKVAALIVLLMVLWSGCRLTKDDGSEKQAHPGESNEPPTVVVAPVIKKSVPIYGEYVATVDPTTGAENVDIRARVDAFLLKQHFTEGLPVSEGELLFTLDDRPCQAQLKSAKAALSKGKADLTMAKENVNVDKAKADLESAKAQLALAELDERRLKPLAEKRAVPQQDYDNAVTNLKVKRSDVSVAEVNLKNSILQQKVNIEQAQAEIESAQASIETANVSLSYCTIRSPIDGVAGKRLVAPGNLVGHGEATLLVTITNLNPLRVNFNISETDYLRIMEEDIRKQTGRRLPTLELILADGSIYKYKGTITITEPTINPKTGTLNVVGEFYNPRHILRPGMFGRIRVKIDYLDNALLIPQKAIMIVQSVKTVYVVDERNSVAFRTVDTGDQVNKMIIVRRGLKDGERVVVEGQLKVSPGLKVKPVLQQAAPGKKEKPEAGKEAK